MILEQIRYYVDDDNRDAFLQVRRDLSAIRGEVGIPVGHLLRADPVPEDGPFLLWQCTYEDEAEMGMAEMRLMQTPSYEAARTRLGALVARMELEFYTVEDGSGDQ
jgi:hypothetical protein